MNYETAMKSDGEEPMAIHVDHTGGVIEDGDAGVAVQSRRRLIIVATIVGALLVAAIVAYLLLRDDGAAAGDGQNQTPAVSVIAPGQTTVAGEITATGSLAARREMPVGVVGEGGRVVSVNVEQGQWVRQGQVLAVIDRSVQVQQADSAAAQIRVSQADADLAQANLNRALQLVERGFISKAEIDQLTATRDAAVARVRVAQAQYRELQARNARLNIIAPAAGLVLERSVEPGQTVSGGGTPLFRIAKGGEMELLAQVGEAELAALSVGVPVEVTPVGGGKSFTGSVWQLAPTINATDRQGTARVALSYAPELRPGGFATAVIRSGTVVAPVLPESALMSDDKGSYVYIVGKDNKVIRRDVTLGNVTASGIIISKGLNGSESIVLRAGGFLNPGETVRPEKAKS